MSGLFSGLFDSTVTNQPSDQSQAQLGTAWNQVQQAAETPYKPYTGQLVAGLNAGQQTAIGQLQGTYGLAQPYIDAGSNQLSSASTGLANVNNYALASSGALGRVQGYMDQASQYAAPMAYDVSPYMNPYTQSVIDTTMATARQNQSIENSGLLSNSIGSGAYGGDRNGIAVATLAGQHDMANNSTIAQLNNQNYMQAQAQFNQEQADRYQTAGIYSGLGSMAGQTAQQYGALGQLQLQTGTAQGQLGGLDAYMGQTAQAQALAGASAGLQGSTLQQQVKQQRDAAAAGRFAQRQAYPFQTAGFLANAANGQAASLGGSTTQGGSAFSNLLGAGLGVMALSGGGSGVGLSAPSFFGGGMNYTFGPKNNANGGRVGFARGGQVGLAAAMPSRHMAGLAAIMAAVGGVNVMHPAVAHGVVPMELRHIGRPHFDDGGVLFNPTAAGLPYAATNPTTANPTWGTIASSGGGAGGAGGSHMPGRDAPSSSSGIGALSTSPSGLAAAVQPSGTSVANDNGSESGGGMSNNTRMGLLAAGMAMMGPGSAFGNIGKGGLAGLQTYLGLQQQDVSNANKQQQFGLDSRRVDIDQSNVDLQLKKLNEEVEYHKGQLSVEQQNALNNQTNAQTQQKNAESEIQTRRAGLVSMVPGFDNNGNPVMYRIDRGNPDNPYSIVTPPGQSATPSQTVAPTSPPAAVAPTPASPSPNLTVAPLPSTPAPGPTLAPATRPAPFDDGTPKPNPTPAPPQVPPPSSPASQPTGVMSWQPTKAPPPGYVPPNQMQISFDPDMKKQQGELGSKIVGESRETYQKAANSQMQLSEMNHSIDNLPRSGVLAPGSFGDERAKFATAANTIATTLGGQPVFDPNKIADTEELKKDAFRLGSQMLANTNGGREAGFIIKSSVGATPSMNNTYAGFKRVSSGLEQANQYAMDRAEFMDNYYSKFGHVSGAEAAFQKLNPWQNYASKAIVTSLDPRAVSYLQQNPSTASAFDTKYGAGISKMVLGQ